MYRRAAVIAVCILAVFAFTGCGQPEKTTAELVLEYAESDEVSKLYGECMNDVNTVIEAAGTGNYQKAMDTNSKIYAMCKAVKDMKVDEKCEAIHIIDSNYAGYIADASDAYCEATISFASGNISDATASIEKGSGYMEKANGCMKSRITYINKLSENGSRLNQ